MCTWLKVISKESATAGELTSRRYPQNAIHSLIEFNVYTSPTFMRRSVITVACIAFSQFIFAQQHAKVDSVVNVIVQHFNDKDPEGLYAMTGEVFRSKLPHDQFVKIAENNLFPAGKIQSHEFLKESGGLAHYKLTFESANLELLVSLDDKDRLRTFVFKPYSKPAADKEAPVATSNPMKTELDRQVDTAVRKYILKANTVGMSIGILNHGKITVYGYGETARGNGKLPDQNSIFEIGSVSKTFTSTLLAYYVEKKKVSLSDPVTKYLPDSVAGNPALKGITLLTLSNHTSGLPRMPDNIFTDGTDPLNPYKTYTKENLFSWLKHCQPEHKPGEQYEYSNLAAGLLGVILERISGKTYEQMVKQVICDKLKMNSTVQHVSGVLQERMVTEYNEEGKPTPAWDFDALAAAGAIRSTVHDLLQYAVQQLHPESDALSRAVALTHKITNEKTIPVALAWHGGETNGTKYLWHNGGTYGAASYIGFVPAKDVAVVLLSNCGENADSVAKEILGHL
jgi:CubicO group peptidase (beta-lactamase class C family)